MKKNGLNEENIWPAKIKEINKIIFFNFLLTEERNSAGQLKTYVKRFFSLWSRNQWKRERYAPAFHLDDYNVDPRSWLRFPILSGGYTRELAAL